MLIDQEWMLALAMGKVGDSVNGMMIIENRIFEMGDHGEVMFEMIVEVEDDFWRAYYHLHHGGGWEDWNPDVFRFDPVYPAARNSVAWTLKE